MCPCQRLTCLDWIISKEQTHQIISNVTATCTTVHGYPDNKVHGANMGPIWGRPDPGGPHVGPMNLAIWVLNLGNVVGISKSHFQLLPRCNQKSPSIYFMFKLNLGKRSGYLRDFISKPQSTEIWKVTGFLFYVPCFYQGARNLINR